MTEDPDRPRQTEAEAQSEATIMPWIWGGIGLVVIAIFVAWAIFAAPHSRLSAAQAPLTTPPPAQPQAR